MSMSSTTAPMRIEAEGYAIHVRAVAGVESCCYIENLDVAFDIGCCPRFAANKGHVFITHGHADHISAFATHAARRSLQRMKPAKYYVPAHLVPHMQQILASFSAMQGDDIQAEIVPLAPLDEVHISAQWMVKAVPTMHRVASLGYILYRKEAKLKREYVGMKGREIGALRRDGHEVTTAVLSPEIAYTGDTTIDVFDTDTFTVANAATSDLAAVEPLAHVNDLLNVKVLITEATYVCDSKTPDDAVARGHIHLDQLIERANRFERVGTIVLVHFSAKYRSNELETTINRKVLEPFRSKLRIGQPASSSASSIVTTPPQSDV